jgi:PUA domain protein
MLQFRNRRRLRRKEIEKIADQLKDTLESDVFTFEDTVDMAEGRDYEIILVNGKILGFVMSEVPFLTVRGLLIYEANRRFVTVDMGAVPFVCNGADIMGPGIVEADGGIAKEDFVWIRDEKHMKPLAVGKALVSGEEMIKKIKGKTVKTILYVGDKLWTMED